MEYVYSEPPPWTTGHVSDFRTAISKRCRLFRLLARVPSPVRLTQGRCLLYDTVIFHSDLYVP